MLIWTLSLALVILIIIEIITILAFLRYRKKIYVTQDRLKNNPKRQIKQIHPQKLFPEFTPNKFGISLGAEASMIMKGHNSVEGATTDYEAWILAVLAKKAEAIFEFGTCTGKTSYLFARNSSNNSKVFTLTLPPSEVENYEHSDIDSELAAKYALSESKYDNFIYSQTDVQNKIEQIFSDSKKFDETKFVNSMDMIFIDGSHAYSFVKNDTEKAMKMIKSGGIILWHDYRDQVESVRDVCKFLDELSKSKTMFNIYGTSLVVHIAE